MNNLRLALLLCPFLFSCSNGVRWPSDEVIKAVFERDKDGFEELARMSNADARLWRIAFDRAMISDAPRTPPRQATARELPLERWDRYRALFTKLGLSQGLTREWTGSGEDLLLPLFSAPSGAVDSVEKGVLYSTESVTDLAPELTLEAIQLNKPNTLHRPLGSNWYLYARYNE